MTENKFDQAKYISDFRKKTYKYIGIQFNKNTEADLIDFISKQPNKNDYIKSLIRKDMEGK